jgi:aryl-alcohol dehydrogenase-like predicted oxidoreductase
MVAYSPVGRGMLTGTLTADQAWAPDDFRPTQPRFSETNLAANVALAEAVREIARDSGVTPAQAALAWLLAQGEDVLPIPGTKRISFLEENVAAADVTLSQDQLDRLAAAVPPAQVAGERYAPSGMRTVGQ